MVNRVALLLPQTEYSALIEYALDELRTPEGEAHFLVRHALIRAGYLHVDEQKKQDDDHAVEKEG